VNYMGPITVVVTTVILVVVTLGSAILALLCRAVALGLALLASCALFVLACVYGVAIAKMPGGSGLEVLPLLVVAALTTPLVFAAWRRLCQSVDRLILKLTARRLTVEARPTLNLRGGQEEP
jgi:hypothetical protein